MNDIFDIAKNNLNYPWGGGVKELAAYVLLHETCTRCKQRGKESGSLYCAVCNAEIDERNGVKRVVPQAEIKTMALDYTIHENTRLYEILLATGHAPSRAQAKRLIGQGAVVRWPSGSQITNPNAGIGDSCTLRIAKKYPLEIIMVGKCQ